MTISILGCGWLGLPLAQHLLNKNYNVKGSTTTKEKIPLLKGAGIEEYLMEIPGDIRSENNRSFWECDILFINIPPGRRNPDVVKDFPNSIQELIEKVKEHEINRVIFISSTSVYDEFGGITKEEDADIKNTARDSGKALVKAERLLMNEQAFDTTIIRFGGLYGYDRHPVKYLAGKKNLDRACKPVNLIHQDDCIEIIWQIIEMDIRNEIFNAVSDGHPPRETFYTSAAEHFGLPLPEFKKDHNEGYRIVSNQKLKERLNYEFIYPNPMDHTP